MPEPQENGVWNSAIKVVRQWIVDTFIDLGRQFRWSYLPPLMVYLAASVSGLTSIVGAFVVKDYLGLLGPYGEPEVG